MPMRIREICEESSENASYSSQRRRANIDAHALVYGVQWPVDHRQIILSTFVAAVP